jgi:hypothetical protein
VGNTTRIIMIWGAAIVIYLLISNSRGSGRVIGSFQDFVTGTTKTLQGR